ncbi:MAG: type I methionyl aminopeptidase [Phycisphaeraceae bacterium]|nr:type I methionyl aminopeptidase [Phycisphaeraceae bacterium]
MTITRAQDMTLAEEAAARVVRIHEALVAMIRPGVTAIEVDRFVAQKLDELGCSSCFLGYRVRGHPPYPSHACISVNDCIVHGTHLSEREPFAPGDLLKIDIGVRYRGFIGDAAWTYSVGTQTELGRRLQECGRESLRRGVQAMVAGRPLIDWAKAVQSAVEIDAGFHLVRGLGGHGIGRSLHEPPFISNVVPSYPGEWSEAWKPFEVGMLLAVEPMIAVSTTEIRTSGREWPIRTADGSLSVHYEADVLITADGPRNLTQGLFNLPDVVGA